MSITHLRRDIALIASIIVDLVQPVLRARSVGLYYLIRRRAARRRTRDRTFSDTRSHARSSSR